MCIILTSKPVKITAECQPQTFNLKCPGLKQTLPVSSVSGELQRSAFKLKNNLTNGPSLCINGFNPNESNLKRVSVIYCKKCPQDAGGIS